MSLVTRLQWLAAVTLIAVVYTHLQLDIYDVAYQGQTHQKTLAALEDENRALKADVLELTSATRLGSSFFDEEDTWTFRDNERVQSFVIVRTAEALDESQRKNGLLSLFDWPHLKEAFAQAP